MIRHDGWSHMIVTLMTCVSTLSNALILLAIEIAILSGASTRWWQSSRRWTPTQMPKTKKYLTSPSERAIPYHAIMNCLRCLSLMMHPFDCAVVAFIRVISHLKHQVVSVLPSVAPSRHLSFWGTTWIHGYERLVKCEAGELRPRSEITWLSWRSGGSSRARNTPIKRWTRVT